MAQTQKERAAEWFTTLRDDICASFESLEKAYAVEKGLEPASFSYESWDRPGGGGGTMGLMRDGLLFEKAGVNVSIVEGEFSEQFRNEIPGAKEDPRFWASGVSLVTHMRSPFLPTVHLNTRMIVTTKTWFGGGTDLTPTFPFAEDTDYFHGVLKETCDRHSPDYYPDFKQQCDEYFFIKHRNEARGVGGIFFDNLDTNDWEKDFSFVQDVGKTILEFYPTIIKRHMFSPYDDTHKAEQYKKRAKYVEFNLVYDRGTRFGLMTAANPDAVLMSLPPEARW